MKKIFSIIFLSAIMLGTIGVAQSQTKFGHVNSQMLLQDMPGRAQAQQELETYAQELEQTFTALQNEYMTKLQNYQDNLATLSETVKRDRERELGNLQERIQEFQQSAQQDLMTRENELLQPIIDTVRVAIEDVAKENGYDYVFDLSVGSLLYAQPADDLMPMVREKLGITASNGANE